MNDKPVFFSSCNVSTLIIKMLSKFDLIFISIKLFKFDINFLKFVASWNFFMKLTWFTMYYWGMCFMKFLDTRFYNFGILHDGLKCQVLFGQGKFRCFRGTHRFAHQSLEVPLAPPGPPWTANKHSGSESHLALHSAFVRPFVPFSSMSIPPQSIDSHSTSWSTRTCKIFLKRLYIFSV